LRDRGTTCAEADEKTNMNTLVQRSFHLSGFVAITSHLRALQPYLQALAQNPRHRLCQRQPS
jgi:hypothetical protein